MKMPRADPTAVARFERLLPSDPDVTVRPMFGQPAAFVSGQMFFGVFGNDVFVRLSAPDREPGKLPKGSRPFEPMPGRPMREYVVVPPAVLDVPGSARPWVDRALAYGRSLGPKPSRRSRR